MTKNKTNYRWMEMLAVGLILTMCLAWFSGCGKGKEEVKETSGTCTIQINCGLLLDKDLNGTGLEELVPDDGLILDPTEVALNPGDTVYDVTRRITKEQKIHMSSQGSSSTGTLYIEAISNIYEKAYNSKSGWVYFVNGERPGISCGLAQLKKGDQVVWAYSLDLGNDL